MNKKWRIRKEYLREDGCFARGGGIEDSEFLPENQEAIEIPVEVPMAAMPTPAFVVPSVGDSIARAMPSFGSQFQAPEQVMPAQEIGAPIMPEMPVAQQPQAQAMPSMSSNPLIAGYQKEANIQGQIAREQADAQMQANQRMEELAASAAQRMAAVQQDIDTTVADMNSGNIDPDRYINSKSPVGKVSTAIGLLLGGIGGGLQGGKENPVMKFLTEQIRLDVEAQKEDRRGKESVLGALQRKYGNEQDALKMATAIETQRLAGKINEAALRSGDAMAQARAQQIIGQLQGQVQAATADVTKRQMTMDAVKQGATAEQLLRMGADPKLISEQFVPGMGLATSAEDKKKLTELSETVQPLLGQIKQLKTLGPKAIVPGTKENQLAKSLSAQIILGAKSDRIGQLGVLSGPDMGIIEKMFTDPTQFSSLVTGQEKTNSLEKFLQDKMKAAAGSRLAVPSAAPQAAPAANQNFGFKKK